MYQNIIVCNFRYTSLRDSVVRMATLWLYPDNCLTSAGGRTMLRRIRT